jgi:hypothetical protein
MFVSDSFGLTLSVSFFQRAIFDFIYVGGEAGEVWGIFKQKYPFECWETLNGKGLFT